MLWALPSARAICSYACRHYARGRYPLLSLTRAGCLSRSMRVKAIATNASLSFIMQKHNPPFTSKKTASAGSATTPKVKALPFKEAGAAESFLWLLLLRKKNGGALLSAIEKQTTEKSNNLALAIPQTSNDIFHTTRISQPTDRTMPALIPTHFPKFVYTSSTALAKRAHQVF